MTLVVCIVNMVMAGLFIIFNEPLAKAAMWCNRKVFRLSVTAADIKRSQVLFLICGTILLIMNAVRFHELLQ